MKEISRPRRRARQSPAAAANSSLPPARLPAPSDPAAAANSPLPPGQLLALADPAAAVISPLSSSRRRARQSPAAQLPARPRAAAATSLFPSPTLRALRRALAAWYQSVKRDLPWRNTRDPYRIWISEIMLQQTRVAAVIPYYERFLAQFPDPAALAASSDDELLAAWAGLGYYSRARNLRAAARLIVENQSFPRTHDEILALPGIGPYTAAAVASISFGLPHAVLDGNVIRVLARLTNDHGDIQSSATRQRLQQTAQFLLDPANPAVHNQAVMELGATVCLPRDPKCKICPISSECAARSLGLEAQLPIKSRRTEILRVQRTLLVVIRNGKILLWQRPPTAAMLGGFWELPELHQLPEAKSATLLHEFSHSITNHIYDFRVVQTSAPKTSSALQWVPLDRLSSLPLSTVARKAIGPCVAPAKL